MTPYKSPEAIQELVRANTTFGGYKQFADDREKRETQIAAFVTDAVYAPEFDYPRLEKLRDYGEDVTESLIQSKKRTAYESMWELEAHRESGILPEETFDSYAAMHEKKLKIMLMVEAADHMRTAGTSQARVTAREEFKMLNTELYGEMDIPAFNGIMAEEQRMVQDFVPAGETAIAIHADLAAYFDRKQFDGEKSELFTDAEFETVRAVVLDRLSPILECFPKTDESVLYTPEEAVPYMQAALDLSGLGAAGWKVEIDPKATVPNTNISKKRIFLPPKGMRNSAQIQRLHAHEAEDHARTAQNGIDSGIELLAKGTADCGDVEEGLGILLECLLSGSFDAPGYNRARNRYITAGLALGTDGSPRDARQTYELMWRLSAVRNANNGEISDTAVQSAKSATMSHIENAYRGTDLVQRGVIYTKLKTYYEGLIKNVRYFKENINTLPEAFDAALLGRYDHTNPEEVAMVKSLIAAK